MGELYIPGTATNLTLTVIAVELRPKCKKNCCDEVRSQKETSIKKLRIIKPRLGGSNF